MSDEWVNDYVGVPYLVNGRDRAGWDCWGLIVAVFQEQHGLRLPDWQVDTLPDGDIHPVSSAQQVTAAVAAGQEHATEIVFPEPWAVAVVHRQRLAHHVGVVVSNGQRILHCSKASRGTACEPLQSFLRSYPKTTFWRLNDLHARSPRL
jgi:cell wall-associated NlpC family hydrolase